MSTSDEVTDGLSKLLDYAKVFDCVDHSVVEQKLHWYGLRDDGLKWFQSYLMNTQQYVSLRTLDTIVSFHGNKISNNIRFSIKKTFMLCGIKLGTLICYKNVGAGLVFPQ